MKTKFSRVTKIILMILSLLLGMSVSWLIKDLITPLLTGGKSFYNRSLFVQTGILGFSGIFIAAFLLFIFSILNSYYALEEKIHRLVRNIIDALDEEFHQLVKKIISSPKLIIELVFLSIVFFLINIRAFIFWNLFPETGNLFGQAWQEVYLWFLALLILFYLLKKQALMGDYLSIWLKEPVLIIFVLFSLASVLWSGMWPVTLHRSLVFTFATAAAVFIGLRYSLKGFLQILFWFGAAIVVVSFIMVLYKYSLSPDFSLFYRQQWSGIFWHKNTLGTIVPILNLVFLIRFFLLKFNQTPIEKTLSGVFYCLSLIEIFFARSATGYILVFLLHIALGAAFLWLKNVHLLRRSHYYIALAVILVGVIGVLLNFNFVVVFLGREESYSTRIPYWTILLRDIVPQNFWIGRGFGTTWANESFRHQMADAVFNFKGGALAEGDDGFIDILLNLGVIGFALFMTICIKVWITSVRFFQREFNLEGFFPFLFMVYIFIANISFSLFMEFEVFTWTLMVTLMIISTRKRIEYGMRADIEKH